MLELQEARTLATTGNRSGAASKVRELATRMRSRNLLAFEFEADLALAELGALSPADLTGLIERARRAQFALIARKAELLRRPRA
jgi:hypothetical protein